MTELPSLSIARVNAMGQAEFVATFGALFEHSPWIAQETWGARPFSSRAELLDKCVRTLRDASWGQQLALIRAHPDLAGRLAALGALTAASIGEQTSAGLDRLNRDEAALFEDYNTRYKARFGFPFIICARLNDKQKILRAFEERLELSPEAEIKTALDEIEKIAALRLAAILPEEKT